MNYSGSDGNNYYDIPVTKYINDSREKLDIIIQELNKTNRDITALRTTRACALHIWKALKGHVGEGPPCLEA